MLRRGALLVLLTALFTPGLFSFQKSKGEDNKVRSVQGVVTDSEDNGLNGAVVQLKNSKTLQVRSFITQDQGAYEFHGLDPNVDYSLKADYRGASSATRTLSAFDSRKQPVINLKIEGKK